MITSSKGYVAYGWKLLVVIQHLVKFGGHRPYGSRDITDLTFQVTLQDHVVQGPCDFMKGSTSFYSPIVPCLINNGIVVVYVSCF